MQRFMDENFLLETETARTLYHNYAAKKPIIDYHCHLVPAEIAEDITYENLTQMWLYADHYKWRYMRSCGVEETYCTGDASDYEKFLAYAKAIGYAIGNPLYHWTHLELQRFFGIHTPLCEKTAPAIWEQTCEMLKSHDFSAKNLIRRSNVEVICTTDDPADDLKYHIALKNDPDFQTKVLPTFRPDNALAIEKETFPGYIETLGKAADMQIGSFSDLKDALQKRMAFFKAQGCKLSDHALSTSVFCPVSDEEADAIFQKAMKKAPLTAGEIESYKTMLLLFLGKAYAKNAFAMQLHLGVVRNNNKKAFQTLGADKGFDSIDDLCLSQKLNKFLDALEQQDALPKTILYTLNPKDNYVLGSLIGNFQKGGVRSKMQFGSAWWFNDQIDGMTEQLKALANLGALSCFVGMLTDSRSFTSYPRHEYFRRILCNLIGGWVESGQFPYDFDVLGTIVEGICHDNAAAYFGF